MKVVSPTRLEEAVRALASATEKTRVLAGGTDLMVELEIGRTAPDLVVDVWRVRELGGVRDEADGLRIGARVTCAELARSPLVARHADVLARAAAEVGAQQIQNRATIGGNLGTASPAADLNPVLFALSARVRLCSLAGTRELAVEDFVTGYRATAGRPDELIESVWIPPRPEGELRAFKKVGTRRAQAIAKVVAAVAVTLDGTRVARAVGAAGSVADRTLRLSAFESALAGRSLDARAIEDAATRAALDDARPVTDVRSTEAYRREVLRRILARMLTDLANAGPHRTS